MKTASRLLLLAGGLIAGNASASPEATSLRNEPSFEDAIVRLDADVHRAPTNAAARGALAYAHARLSHRTIARVTAQEALNLDSHQALAHLALGITGVPEKTSSCTAEKGSKEKHLKQAIASDSTLEEAWKRLAEEYEESKDPAAAQQCRRKAVELGFWDPATLDYGRALLADVPDGAILATTGKVADLCLALQAMGTRAEVPVVDVNLLGDKSYRERLAARGVPLLKGSVWEPSWKGEGEPPTPWLSQVDAWLVPKKPADARRVVTSCAAAACENRLRVRPVRRAATWEYFPLSAPDTSAMKAVRQLSDSLASQPPTSQFGKPGSGVELGDWVHVDELPATIVQVPPEYPEDARLQNTSGTVMVQALVGRNGRVEDACIAKSVSGLDAAAIRAVIQWEFKPARSKGHPVAVWVAVPVKFSLH